jgi:DNA-binding SARP family transcriptional activator
VAGFLLPSIVLPGLSQIFPEQAHVHEEIRGHILRSQRRSIDLICSRLTSGFCVAANPHAVLAGQNPINAASGGRVLMPRAMGEALAQRCSVLEVGAPLVIYLFGGLRVLQQGEPVTVGSKAALLLCLLARRHGTTVPRETIVSELWPDQDFKLAGRSLNTLVWSLRRRLGGVLGGAPPILQVGGMYRLNTEAGVTADTALFEALADAGAASAREGAQDAACEAYERAVALYRGDLYLGADPNAECIIAREQLRARFQELLAHLASYRYERGDVAGCLDAAQQLLGTDPCREDMHRLIMRCYVARGERSRALHQFRLCAALLRAEFDVEPEADTITLYQGIRLGPAWRVMTA